MTTWGRLRLDYLSAVGDTQAARDECWQHLTEGSREVYSRLDVPELEAIDETVNVPANNDYVDMATVDFDSYALLDVYNVTEGFPMYPEPGGMTGRNRYLDPGTTKPPTGGMTNYIRSGTRLYVRDMREEATVLRVRIKRQAPVLDATMTNDSPLTPAQYDTSIVYGAAWSYFMLHKATEGEGQATILLSDKYRTAMESKLAVTPTPRIDEDRSQMNTMRLTGYSFARRRG